MKRSEDTVISLIQILDGKFNTVWTSNTLSRVEVNDRKVNCPLLKRFHKKKTQA